MKKQLQQKEGDQDGAQQQMSVQLVELQ